MERGYKVRALVWLAGVVVFAVYGGLIGYWMDDYPSGAFGTVVGWVLLLVLRLGDPAALDETQQDGDRE